MAAPVLEKPALVSVDEYFAMSSGTADRLEYVDGKVEIVVGGSLNHAIISANFLVQAQRLLANPSAIAFSSEVKLVTPEHRTYFHPDGMIACPVNVVNAAQGVIDNPTVILEVLSDATEARDRQFKLPIYLRLPSARQIVYVSSNEPYVERYTLGEDGEWRFAIYSDLADSLELASVGITIPLEELYARVDFEV